MIDEKNANLTPVYTFDPAEEYEIIIDGERKQGKTSDGRPYDFIAWNGWDKTNKRASFRFTQKCENVPKDPGSYRFIIKKRDINLDRQRRYKTYWINTIAFVQPYSYENSREVDEDLPF